MNESHSLRSLDVSKNALNDAKFKLILADPPWQYHNFLEAAHGAAESQYDTMKTDDIRAIPVSEWADDDCVLCLWATWPKLRDALEVVDSWGFEYVTGLPWIKTMPNGGTIRTGIGFWTQSASEMLLFGRMGKARRRNDNHVIGLLVGNERQFYAPRTKHSSKPQGVHDWIEKTFEGPFLELFGTKRRANWTVWGKNLGYFLSINGISTSGPIQQALSHDILL